MPLNAIIYEPNQSSAPQKRNFLQAQAMTEGE